MEDKIEVGEYVRNKDGYIGKVKKIIELNKDKYFEEAYYICDILMASSCKSDIVKHSKQLIDLIEIGDFVNGMEILHIDDNKLYVEWSNEFEEFTGFLENKDIQTILTRESYMANCYKVGGEDERYK